jgi:hypothetical protein
MTDPGLDPERVARVAAALAIGERDPARSFCSASAALVGVAGSGVVLVSAGRVLGNVCVSDPVTEAVEEVQYALGEGPCIEAFRSKAPVLAPDLASLELAGWAGFCEGALAAGMRAAFGFPLLVRPACIGALNFYHDRTGELGHEQFADALAAAHVTTRAMLGWQSFAEPGSLAWQLEQVPAHRAAIHQASGMVSVQASIPVEDALALLRAHAFAEARTVGEIATEVVAGRLRFES